MGFDQLTFNDASALVLLRRRQMCRKRSGWESCELNATREVSSGTSTPWIHTSVDTTPLVSSLAQANGMVSSGSTTVRRVVSTPVKVACAQAASRGRRRLYQGFSAVACVVRAFGAVRMRVLGVLGLVGVRESSLGA